MNQPIPMRTIRLFSLLLILFSQPFALKAQLVINEYSASNLTQFVDDHSDYEDWVELFNPGPTPINLSGYHLSDDLTNAMKYTVPAGAVIPANGFFRFWCSGRNTNTTVSYHTNFRLTQTKNTPEKLILSDPSGIILDSLTLQKTQSGHSRGRTTNGASGWSIFTSPTPNNTNTASVPYSRYADRPDFSVPPGFYPSPVIVIITSTEPGGTIRYTTNGSLPTTNSTVSTGAVQMTGTTVLKAVTWSPDPTVLPSFVEFHTYFLNVSHTLPVISVSATQLSNLANGSGNLVPIGSFEYFDTSGIRKANTYGEFNRHGQDSWVLSQRSLDFISRDEMGYNHSVEEKLFEYSTRENFQRLILRASGDDNYPADYRPANQGSAHVRDAYIHMLAKKGGMNLDVRNAEKVVVYLNGMYWGVYDIRENPDEHDYTDYYYGQDKYNLQYILTWGNTWAEYGGPTALSDWNSLYNYIMTHNMANPSDYNYVTGLYDATSLVDYVIANAITVCSDWLNYNTGWWRGMDPNGQHRRWGYILWDNDATFGHYINYTGIPNTGPYADPCDPEGLGLNSDPEGHIQVLNRLRQNPEFNQYYISRMADLWNTVFSCDNMISQLDSIIAKLSPEMPAHCTRWNGTLTGWQTNVDTLRQFILDRCNNLASGISGCYNLTGPFAITVTADPIGAGAVKFNTLTHDDLPWTGNYFGGMSNRFEALPQPPYQFTHWSSVVGHQFLPGDSINPVWVNPSGSDTITAHFNFATAIFPVTSSGIAATLYPTILSQQTYLDFSLPESRSVSIQLFDLQGQLLHTFANKAQMQSGFHNVQLLMPSGSLAPGVYIVRLTAGSDVKAFRLVKSE